MKPLQMTDAWTHRDIVICANATRGCFQYPSTGAKQWHLIHIKEGVWHLDKTFDSLEATAHHIVPLDQADKQWRLVQAWTGRIIGQGTSHFPTIL